ncbi:MAG: biopolymer transporter ExbD [Planctomycetota bacterium]
MAAQKSSQQKDFRIELTPLIDVAFLVLIFFMCLPFRTLNARLAAFLPTERGFPERRAVEPMKITVRIFGREEQPRDWGGELVPAPTTVVYRYGDNRTTDDLDVVHRHIVRMKREAEKNMETELVGEIRAAPRVQHKYAIALVNRFAEARVSKVDFEGRLLPKGRSMDAKRMPYPRSLR